MTRTAIACSVPIGFLILLWLVLYPIRHSMAKRKQEKMAIYSQHLFIYLLASEGTHFILKF